MQYTNRYYEPANHHRLLCEKLEAVERGECRRLMVFMPPRHGKSELVSRRFPAWFIGRNPRKEIISASYGATLAVDFGRDVKNTLETSEFKVLFPDVRLAADSQSKIRWHTSHGGGYVTAGVDTAITGRGADILNIDDPVKNREEAESSTRRETVWAWYRSAAYTRLMPGGSVILTMTRWHEDDLAGRLLEQAEKEGDKWEIISLPAISPEGNALWPERYPISTLNQIRNVLEERDWGALYQQNPRPSGTSFFDIERILIEQQPVDYPIICDAVYATMDTAIKTGKQHDGTAVVYFSLKNFGDGYKIVILDWELVQIEGGSLEFWFPSVFQHCEELAQICRARYGSTGVFVEDKASGSILIQQGIRQEWPIHAIKSTLTAVGKDERAISISGYVTRGDVKISRFAYDKVTSHKGRSANHFINQVFRYQIGVKDQEDDILDCFCYGIAIGIGNGQGQ